MFTELFLTGEVRITKIEGREKIASDGGTKYGEKFPVFMIVTPWEHYYLVPPDILSSHEYFKKYVVVI